MSVLVLVEHEDGAIKEGSLSAITAGAQLGEVTAVLMGEGASGAASAAAAVAGVAKAIHIEDAALNNGMVAGFDFNHLPLQLIGLFLATCGIIYSLRHI